MANARIVNGTVISLDKESPKQPDAYSNSSIYDYALNRETPQSHGSKEIDQQRRSGDSSNEGMITPPRELNYFITETVYRLRYETMTYDYISPSVEQLLGYTPDEIQGTDFRSLIIQARLIDDRGINMIHSFDFLEHQRSRGKTNQWSADYLMFCKDGSTRWVTDLSHPWIDSNGDVIGSIGSLRDITHRVRAEEKMRRDLTDSSYSSELKGVLDHVAFFQALDAKIKRVNRNKKPIALLVMSIDTYSNIQQDYGPELSHRLIQETASIIRESLRKTDILGCLKGDEFGIILPSIDADNALMAARRIRAAVIHHSFILGKELPPLQCNLSVGVASATGRDNITSAELHRLAGGRHSIARTHSNEQIATDDHI